MSWNTSFVWIFIKAPWSLYYWSVDLSVYQKSTSMWKYVAQKPLGTQAPGLACSKMSCFHFFSDKSKTGLGNPQLRMQWKQEVKIFPHIFKSLYISDQVVIYGLINIAGNKNSMSPAWHTSKEWLDRIFPPLFCSGKGDKRQIDPGHFIFF